MKLVTTKDTTGRSILPIEQARKDLGYTDIEQGRMRDWDENVTLDPQIAPREGRSRMLQATVDQYPRAADALRRSGVRRRPAVGADG